MGENGSHHHWAVMGISGAGLPLDGKGERANSERVEPAAGRCPFPPLLSSLLV